MDFDPVFLSRLQFAWEAASSERTQAFLLVGTLVLLPVIVMYTGWSYWVFRGKVRADAGHLQGPAALARQC
jgi:cytochrome bd-type quinol oxidase subunit 2